MVVRHDELTANVHAKPIFTLLLIVFLLTITVFWWLEEPLFGKVLTVNEIIALGTMGYVILTYSLLDQNRTYVAQQHMPILALSAESALKGSSIDLNLRSHNKNPAKNISIKVIVAKYDSSFKGRLRWWFRGALSYLENLIFLKIKTKDSLHIYIDYLDKDMRNLNSHDLLMKYFDLEYKCFVDKDGNEYSPESYFSKEKLVIRVRTELIYESILSTVSGRVSENHVFSLNKGKFIKEKC